MARYRSTFGKGCGTREAIDVMGAICERILEHGKEVFICFVDFEKAFDRLDSVKLLAILKRIGADWRDRRLIMICESKNCCQSSARVL